MHADVSSMVDAFPAPEEPESSVESKPTSFVPDRDIPSVEAPPPGWTSSILAERSSFRLQDEAARFGVGVGLSALYGLSLGAREGGRAFFAHAVGVPLALIVVAAMGVPALYIGLSLFDVPVGHERMIAASSRASARTGLVLAGLAPAAALFVVTSEGRMPAVLASLLGLMIAGVIGLGSMLGELHRSLRKASASARVGADLTFMGFFLFATLLAARIWLSTLPLLGGGR